MDDMRIIVIIVTMKNGAKMVCPCSNPAFEKQLACSGATLRTGELNMRAEGEERNGREKN